MSRIPFPDNGDLSQVSPLRRTMASDKLAITRMLTWLPEDMLAGFAGLARAVLTNETLDPILRELAIVRVGYLSNAPYEIHQHIQLARSIGVSEAKLEGLKTGPDAPVFSKQEHAVLRFVDEIVLNVQPSDEALAQVRAHLSLPEIFTLLFSAGLYMVISRVLETTGVELEADGVVVDPRKRG